MYLGYNKISQLRPQGLKRGLLNFFFRQTMILASFLDISSLYEITNYVIFPYFTEMTFH